LQNSSANQHSETINGVGSKLKKMFCIQHAECFNSSANNTIAGMSACF